MHHWVQLVYDITGDSPLTIISLIVSCIAVWYAIWLWNKQINLSNEQGKIIEEQMKVTKYQAKLFEIQNMLIDMQIWYSNVNYLESLFNKTIEEWMAEKSQQKTIELHKEATDLKNKAFSILDQLEESQKQIKKKQDILDNMKID